MISRKTLGVACLLASGPAWAGTPANRTDMQAQIDAQIRSNGTGAITGAVLNGVLSNLLASVSCIFADTTCLPASALTGSIGLVNGGTGQDFSAATGLIKVTSGQPATTVAAPTGAIVGTSDAQTLTNKSISTSQLTGTITAAQMPALTGDVTSTAGTVSTTVGKINGTTVTAPASGLLVGTTDAQTLTNKSIVATQLTGTVPAANGGAGTITGALKANGSGTVTQAACADLSNGATGCSTATGTSGATIPLLNGTNTFSGSQSFGSGTFKLNGATSGTAIVNAPATGGGTLTFPSGTDTILGAASTATLTNKTFNTTGTGNSFSISGVAVSRGQYPGVNANTSATAGNVGEYISSFTVSGSAVALTSGTAANVASVSLTAGEWLVCGDARFTGGATTAVQYLLSSLSTTSGTVDITTINRLGLVIGNSTTMFSFTTPVFSVGCADFLLSGTTTVFLVSQAGFSTSTASAYGGLSAIRTH